MMLDQNLTAVGIVDDHEVVRLGLVSAILKKKHLRLIGEGATADEALSLAMTSDVDVLVLDLNIPGGGMNALKEIAKNRPKVRCIIYTASDDATVAMAAIQNGARGYVLKCAGIENLFRSSPDRDGRPVVCLAGICHQTGRRRCGSGPGEKPG